MYASRAFVSLSMLLLCLFLLPLVSGSAVDCDCGTPWAFYLPSGISCIAHYDVMETPNI